MTKKKNEKSIKIYRMIGAYFVTFIIVFIFLYSGLPFLDLDNKYIFNKENISSVISSTDNLFLEENNNTERKATHVSVPDSVKGIYMTACVASVPSLRNNLIKLIQETELNTVVLDIKSYDGHITFDTGNEKFKPAQGGSCFVKDMQDLIDELHSYGIFVSGRIAVFQDKFMADKMPEWAVKKESDKKSIWRDRKGLPWIDAGTKDYWDYIIELAKESYEIGFDEINFDYIRFPSDGNMNDIFYPLSNDKKKTDVIRSFFSYLHDNLKDTGLITSADLFGMTTTSFNDLNIGQILEDALPYFDYIAPMVYPSHYPFGFYNLGDPNENVYEVIKISMDSAVARTVSTTTKVYVPDSRIGTSTPAVYSKKSFDKNKIRPWLQDNNYPVTYTAEMVRAQIQATYDAGLDSWMLWNAGNKYTRSALNEE